MSDDKTTPVAPAPAPKPIEAPLMSFVKGGTVSSAYENEIARKNADAETRRNAEAQRQLATAQDPMNARMSTTKLGGHKSHAAIVLEIKNSDGKTEEWITCELNAGREDATELVLVMCCPSCARKYGMGEAQMHFSNKHKRFELDQRRQGELWVNPKDPNDIVLLAGTIHLTEVVSCPGLGCTWRFKIDDSVLKTL